MMAFALKGRNLAATVLFGPSSLDSERRDWVLAEMKALGVVGFLFDWLVLPTPTGRPNNWFLPRVVFCSDLESD